MNISGFSNQTNVNQPNESPLSLKKAIKAYRDEMLTGLTDDEKSEIDRLSKEYLEKNQIKTKQDRAAFDNFVKSLLKKFGFKGDADEFSAGMSDEMQSKLESSEPKQSTANTAEYYQKTSLGAMSAKNKLLS